MGQNGNAHLKQYSNSKTHNVKKKKNQKRLVDLTICSFKNNYVEKDSGSEIKRKTR